MKVQHGRESLDIDFCSITIDGGLDNDILQQRLHHLVKQRKELQNMELELRAQVIARSEIVRLQNSFDGRIKDHTNANAKLQVCISLFHFSCYGSLDVCILHCDMHELTQLKVFSFVCSY